MVVSLYRKYRPQIFDQVVGQEHIERTLRNAVADGNVSHAYLFCGPRGTGKTTSARLLAKALLCENGPTADPCGTCEQCKDIAAGVHPDVYELDAASRTGVDNVREEIIGRVAFAPTRGRYKVYIIDEVHMLSTAAFNALLKTLEEPPEHVVFILCTTDPHKVPETIISRCQRFDFHRISVVDIMANLRMICQKEGIEAEEDALELIARHSSGGMRDAITTLEQLSVFSEGHIKVADAEGLLGEVESTQMQSVASLIADRDIAGCFSWVGGFVEGGTDIAQFAKELTAYFRDLYVMTITGTDDGITDIQPDEYEKMTALVQSFGGPDRISRDLIILSDLNAELRYSTDARLSLEVAFTRMARPDVDLTLESLAERVEALENDRPIQQGTVPAPAARFTPAAPTTSAFRPVPAAPATPVARVMPAAPVAAAHIAPAASPAPAASVAPAAPAAPTTPAVPAAPASSATFASFKAAAAPVAPAVPTTQVPGQAASVVASGELSNATATRLWAATIKTIQRRKPSLIGVLANTHASVAPGGETLVIELPASSAFSKRMLEESDNNELIRGCIAETFGRVVPFRITTSGRGPEPAPLMPVEEAPTTDLFGHTQEDASADVTPAGDGGAEAAPQTLSMDIPAPDEAPAQSVRSVYASIPVVPQPPKPLYTPPHPTPAPAQPTPPPARDAGGASMISEEIPEVQGSIADLIFGAFPSAKVTPPATSEADAAGADGRGSEGGAPSDASALTGASGADGALGADDAHDADGTPEGSGDAAMPGGYPYDEDVPPLSDDEVDGYCDNDNDDEGED